LYAALRDIDRKGQNILTLEDPIEYRLEGISQTQVNDKKGITFASGLRSVLRQDPDIIMVGEIRDHETAVMAIQSALTGHLVLSTLHTNDAASAVTRLLDLGIEPYLLASSLIGVVAQRLVRRVCAQCAAPARPPDEEMAQLGWHRARGESPPLDGLRAGAGCAVCRRTGYRGRIGLFELLVVDDTLRRNIQARANSTQIKTAAIAGGMATLRDDGIAKALAGATTIDEVVRVTLAEEEAAGSEAI
jgi:type II secretory ATPase GspE/PulE/Tfp pilus assembly ATPase PilB-like protein